MPSRKARNAKRLQQQSQQNDQSPDNNSTIISNLPSDLSFDDTPPRSPSPPRPLLLEFDEPPGSENPPQTTMSPILRIRGGVDNAMDFGMGYEESGPAVTEEEQGQGNIAIRSPVLST